MNTTYGMGDIGMAAFSVFFMQSPSFLAHQRQFEEGHGRSNGASLFGIAKIPSDNYIRAMLDPASPTLLHPVFADTIEQLRRIDGGEIVAPVEAVFELGQVARHVLLIDRVAGSNDGGFDISQGGIDPFEGGGASGGSA